MYEEKKESGTDSKVYCAQYKSQQLPIINLSKLSDISSFRKQEVNIKWKSARTNFTLIQVEKTNLSEVK
jgi:hypothetical protein